MLPRGSAKKVTIYLNDDTRHHVEALWTTIVNFLRHKHVAGASVSRLLMGFGTHERLHDAKSEYTDDHVPIRIEFVETAEKVEELLPDLYELVTDGLIEVQETTVIKSVCKGRQKSTTASAMPVKEQAAAAKLVRIYLGESDKYKGEPLYNAIVKKLRMLDFSGATVYRGIVGYGVKRHTHKAGLLHMSHDLPILISIVEKPERVDELIDAVSAMMQDGLIVTSDVELRRILQQVPERENEVTDALGKAR